jgi:hypothetical protein
MVLKKQLKILSNSKAMHFYNVTELVFLILLIAIALGTIFLFLHFNNLSQSDDLIKYHYDLKYMQALRTFAQTPLEGFENIETIAEGMNEYVSLDKQKHISDKQRKLKINLLHELESRSKQFFESIEDDNLCGVTLALYKGNSELESYVLYVVDGGCTKTRQLQIPTYLNLRGEEIGDFDLRLRVTSKK